MRLELRLSKGCQHEVVEQLGVEKVRIYFPCIMTVARVLRINRNHQFFPDLETQLKVIWDLLEILAELLSHLRASRGLHHSQPSERAIHRC